MDFNYLTLIIFLPVAGAIVISLVPGLSSKLIRYIASLFTFIPLAISIFLFIAFDRSTSVAGTIQFEELSPWISAINANYHLGVDGLSLPLVLLTTLIGFLVVLISWKINTRVREYFAWLLLLETSILGVFCSLDLLLFFIFWEIEVIPMYFLISIWGAGRKEYSAIKYVVYTLFGSALMLAGILSLYFTTGSLSIIDMTHSGSAMVQSLMPAAPIFFMLLAGFAIKLPVFPLHTWLPDAHTDAPTAGSVVLAGTLIKMGGYGMIRVCVGIFPQVAQDYAQLLLALAVINIVYGAAVTLRQTDLKRLIAYSSISHMGFVLLGIFALGELSMVGAGLQMFSHGIVTGLLFAVTGLVMHNTGERNIGKLGGLAKQIPFIAVIFTIGGLASMGVPGTSGFIAEVTVFIGAFSSNIVDGVNVYTIISMLGILLAAAYILWLLRGVFFNHPLEKFNGTADADRLEKTYCAIFVAAILVIGMYPMILTDVIRTGITPIANLLGG
ncbi:MAG: NADH-quinone oxidoreductase subunit M [Dehalococcoidia bacterium]|nr:MAG: NADH-quinone oxidoreductase subunit M [Dehalococcoidia bacterium]